MFNKDYYEAMDRVMVDTLKGTALTVMHTMVAIVYYLLMQPIRLYDYVCDCIATEQKSRRDEEIRFQRLKQNGRI